MFMLAAAMSSSTRSSIRYIQITTSLKSLHHSTVTAAAQQSTTVSSISPSPFIFVLAGAVSSSSTRSSRCYSSHSATHPSSSAAKTSSTP
jgi:hypothetical protein